MFDFSTLTTFIAVVLGLFLIPGPAVLLVLSRTVQGGRRAGIMTGLGIATGDFVHTVFAAVGLSAVLMTSALAFTAVKFVGAAYLIYLGIRAILAKQGEASLPNMPVVTPRKAFLQAVPAEVLNPKTALFFLAFMPQFVHPERGSVFLQFAVLGLIFVALSSLYTTLIAWAIRPLGRLAKHLSWLRRWQGKMIGTIFIGLGIKVATQHR
ncbi:LysE family translocator [Pararobbsia silviterrae]|uniref:LysE family translocator n=1 Tax=Pararobbsia silviterrae TaxID=1792498 RepID=A0A494XJT5_9BURK|nr:LysE family translocator [Pararobbsia silviterrae]RKP47813.1 LysE family translocator [Pararobbsia silviterrae]